MGNSKRRGRPPYDDILTPAEWRIVHAAQHGMSNREIATLFGITRDGVKFHISNAVSKLGLKNKQALRHWFAVPKHSVMQHRENTMESNGHLSAIGQIARSVSDISQSEAWYRDVLGLPHLFTFGKLAFFECNGVRLFLNEDNRQPANDSILYFSVDDIQASHEQLSARGVEFISTPHMVHRHDDGSEEWMAFFNDPEGRPLAIMASVAAD